MRIHAFYFSRRLFKSTVSISRNLRMRPLSLAERDHATNACARSDWSNARVDERKSYRLKLGPPVQLSADSRR